MERGERISPCSALLSTIFHKKIKIMIRNYVKIAIRNLLKNRVYSSINVMGLSIGLVAAILILLYIKDDTSYDRFHTKNPNIYRVVSDWYHPDGSIGHHDGLSSNLQGPIFKAKIP